MSATRRSDVAEHRSGLPVSQSRRCEAGRERSDRSPEVTRRLTDSWELGPYTVKNRVVLAPLAGIGNWFVRLQAKRYGAGLAFSEMISSFAIHYGNRKTLDELLVVHPDERTHGPASPQLL